MPTLNHVHRRNEKKYFETIQGEPEMLYMPLSFCLRSFLGDFPLCVGCQQNFR